MARVVNDQLSIFASAPTARREDAPTSVAAGRSVSALSTLQAAILDELYLAPDGLTDDELVERFPMRCAGTTIKRRTELARANLVVDSGTTRQTRNDRAAIVWRWNP